MDTVLPLGITRNGVELLLVQLDVTIAPEVQFQFHAEDLKILRLSHKSNIVFQRLFIPL